MFISIDFSRAKYFEMRIEYQMAKTLAVKTIFRHKKMRHLNQSIQMIAQRGVNDIYFDNIVQLPKSIMNSKYFSLNWKLANNIKSYLCY